MSAIGAVRLLNDIVSRVDTAAEKIGTVWKVLFVLGQQLQPASCAVRKRNN